MTILEEIMVHLNKAKITGYESKDDILDSVYGNAEERAKIKDRLDRVDSNGPFRKIILWFDQLRVHRPFPSWTDRGDLLGHVHLQRTEEGKEPGSVCMEVNNIYVGRIGRSGWFSGAAKHPTLLLEIIQWLEEFQRDNCK